ncbi:fasciclin domain-containing protein [Pedobacter sp. P351]|uniref:fasciclin domain-containing protein n=1 Tax=Pedobacter superstes TaxID=3133441 RepID=UPI0030985BDE
MKKYKTFFSGIKAAFSMTTVLALVVALNACQKEDFSFQEQNRSVLMMDMLRQDTSLSLTVEALEITKMASTLNTFGPFTFFAPDNNGFKKFLRNAGKSSLSQFSAEELKTIMAYHILPTRLKAAEFIQGPQPVPTGRGDYITLDVSKGYKFNSVANGKAKVYETDIQFANGFVHKMDGVLDPPTLTIGQFLSQNADQYSIMIGGLHRAGLMDTLTNLTNHLNERIRLTLFAETNGVLQAAGITTFDNMPLDELKKLMKYHIIRGGEFSSSYSLLTPAIPLIKVNQTWGNTILSLNGNEYLYFDLAAPKLINNDTDFSASDVIMRNGVLHNVDKPLAFRPDIPRTQIVHSFSTATNFAFGVTGVSSTAAPAPTTQASGNWRLFNEFNHPRGGTIVHLFFGPDSPNDSLVTVVRNVRKGKYSFAINYKNGSRGDFQLMHNEDKIGGVLNYGAGTTFHQNVVIGTYNFITSGDKRIKFVAQASRVSGAALDVMVLSPVN